MRPKICWVVDFISMLRCVTVSICALIRIVIYCSKWPFPTLFWLQPLIYRSMNEHHTQKHFNLRQEFRDKYICLNICIQIARMSQKSRQNDWKRLKGINFSPTKINWERTILLYGALFHSHISTRQSTKNPTVQRFLIYLSAGSSN